MRDVRTVLDHASSSARHHLVERVAPLVVSAAVEVAVLDRQIVATDPAVLRMYGRIIADALDLHDDPLTVLELWYGVAPAALARFEGRWNAFLVSAERNSEGRYWHEKLVDLAEVSAALNLTRPRIRIIFGDAKCELPPVRMTDRTFTVEEHRDVRALAKRVGLTAPHIRDIALKLDPAEFCDRLLRLELMILPDLDKVRPDLKKGSDVSLSRSIRRWGPSSKPGPKRKAITVDAQVKAIAKHRHESPATVYRIMSALKAWLERSETGDSAVTLRASSCHVESEFDALGLSDFDHLFSTELPDEIELNGATISDPYLIAIASIPRYRAPDKGPKRKRYDYSDRDLVITWWEATRNETPSPERIRQWARRGWFTGYRNSARLWKAEQDLRAKEDAEARNVGTVVFGKAA